MKASQLDFLAMWVKNITETDNGFRAVVSPNRIYEAETLSGIFRLIRDYVTREIVTLVSEALNVDIEKVFRKKQKQEISDAKFISIFIIRSITDCTEEQTGALFNIDHSTVNWAVKQVKNIDVLQTKLRYVYSCYPFLTGYIKNKPHAYKIFCDSSQSAELD